MAIDTALKRRSAACFKPILKAPLPAGTIGAAQRAHAGWLYAGISISEPTVAYAYKVFAFTSSYRNVKAMTG